jgi:hypothetical protein
MYKPGATFYDPLLEKTLVCCSGNNLALCLSEKKKCVKFSRKKITDGMFSVIIMLLAGIQNVISGYHIMLSADGTMLSADNTMLSADNIIL